MMASRFRLAALQIEDLVKCRKWKEMQEHLDRPPSTLFAMYDRILLRLDPRGRKDARKVLLWLAFSVHKLNLRQLVEVIAVNFDTEVEPCFDPASRYEDPQEIFRVCSGLIVGLEGDAPTYKLVESIILMDGADEIKLAHLFVKEYLLSSTSTCHISERDSHTLISTACLTYLLQFDSLDSSGSTVEAFPLTVYAAQNWISHVKSAGEDGSNRVLQDLMLKLFHSGAPLFVSWVRVHGTMEEAGRYSLLVPYSALLPSRHPSHNPSTPLFRRTSLRSTVRTFSRISPKHSRSGNVGHSRYYSKVHPPSSM